MVLRKNYKQLVLEFPKAQYWYPAFEVLDIIFRKCLNCMESMLCRVDDGLGTQAFVQRGKGHGQSIWPPLKLVPNESAFARELEFYVYCFIMEK